MGYVVVMAALGMLKGTMRREIGNQTSKCSGRASIYTIAPRVTCGYDK